ncbi:hypothetical protein ACF0H5_015357 [Mactra antiquata]
MVFFCLNCAKKFDSQVEYDEHDCIDGIDIDANFPVQENKRVKYEKVTHEKHCRQKKVTEKDVTNCKKCGKKFTLYTNRKRHEKKCMEFHRKGESSMYSNSVHSTFTCPQCKKEFPNASQLIEHQNKTGHVRAGGSRDFQSTSSINHAREKTGKLRCRTCNNFFDTHSELYNHRVLEHNQSDVNSKKFQNTPWNSSEIPPWMKEDGTINSELKLTYEQHRHLILKQKETELTNEIRFNFPTTNNITLQDLVHHLEEIYTKLDFTFKSVLIPISSYSHENIIQSNLKKTSSHVPICVCLCSNVPQYNKEKFIFHENLDELMSEMIKYLYEISNFCEKLAHERWQFVFDGLTRLEEKWGLNGINDLAKSETNCENENARDDDDDDDDDDNDICSTTDEAMETELYDPPSSEFLHAISKENVYVNFLKTVSETNKISSVEYNNWNNYSCDDDDDDDDNDDDDDDDNDNDDYNDDDDVNVDDDNDDGYSDNGNDGDDDDDDDKSFFENNYLKMKQEMRKKIKYIRKEFEKYCTQLPVIGFNSVNTPLHF